MDTAVTLVAFREGAVEVDGARLRYREAGQGSALVHLSGPDGLTPAHGLLAQRFRVVMLRGRSAAAPRGDGGPGDPPARSRRLRLMGTASDGATALGLALLEPTRVRALVLEAPTAGERRGSGAPASGRRDAHAGAARHSRRRESAPALGRACKARIAGSHLVFVYDAGAAIGRDRPEAFAEVVADFLERREAFVISRARTVLHP